MAIRLRKVETLAGEINKTPDETIAMLSLKGIATVDGYYDSALFDAILKEPVVATKQRLDWGISHRLGIGAAKHILDPLGIRITVHDCKGAQYLMLKRSGISNYVKWQYNNTWGKRNKSCVFQVRGFMTDAKFDHYLFTCFDGPFAWAVSRKQMINAWNNLHNGKDVELFSLQADYEDYEPGSLLVRLSIEQSKFELKNPSQLGF